MRFGLIRLRPPITIERPTNIYESEEVIRVQWALMHLKLRRANIIPVYDDDRPLVKVTYDFNESPLPFWAKWLFVRILTEHDIGWRARLCGYDAGRHYLYFTPAQDGLETHLASQAAEARHRIREIWLGVPRPTTHFIQRFPFLPLPPLPL